MTNRVFRLTVLLLMAVLALGWGIAGGNAQEKNTKKQKKADASKAELKGEVIPSKLADRLATPISFDFEPGPLKDALEYISNRYVISIVVDTEAFKGIGFNEVENSAVKLQKLSGVKLRMAIRLILDQVQGDFQIDDGILVVVPKVLTDSEHQLQRPIDATFNQVPLADALRQISESTGFSLVLDAKERERSLDPISANLTRVPLESAVLMLTDMLNLKPVAIGNALYITSADNADRIQGELETKKQKMPNACEEKKASTAVVATPTKP